MSRVILGQFPTAALPPLRRPSVRTRELLSKLTDDLQVIAAGNCPLALAAIALLAQRYAAPVRLQLRRQQLKAERTARRQAERESKQG